MKYSENAINVLTTSTFRGIGKAWIVKNLKGGETVEQVVDLLNAKLNHPKKITLDLFEKQKEIVINKLNSFGDSCDGVLAIGDEKFPRYRGIVKRSEQPVCLFYKGDIKLLDIENNNISVIGLLNPTKEIELRESRIIEELVNHNITVVSGLAFGCDSIAHIETLKRGGKTVAILPVPIHDILPARNKNLAYKIVENRGLLVTEYYEEFKSRLELNTRYRERDRLQALFCDAIILIASYSPHSARIWNLYDKKLDSGARLAMEYAKNYNIPRAVMYSKKVDIHNPMFDLNRQLIVEDDSVIILTKNTLKDIIKHIHNYKK